MPKGTADILHAFAFDPFDVAPATRDFIDIQCT
jgi:hypothetical protein